MKYKVGDRVKIKSIDWYNENKDETGFICNCFNYSSFIPKMSLYCGNILTITQVVEEFEHYLVEECGFAWTDEMIEGLVGEGIEPIFKIGDEVIAYAEGCIAKFSIKDVRWNSELNKFEYKICSSWYDASVIQLYKEANKIMNENNTKVDMGKVSDGYHTFNELYEYRLLYNASFFNELAKQNLYDVHKSKKHSDGEDCFGGGHFIVMAELPTGQVSNHYELKDWNLFQVPEREKANKWDGHTPQDVAKRIREFLNPKSKYPKTYEECIGKLPINWDSKVEGYKCDLLTAFQKLLICRDVYWKIAGEEMGSGKPWEPNWEGEGWYVIVNHKGKIIPQIQWCANAILAFPTEEMRDVFYENFKELIESVKELL